MHVNPVNPTLIIIIIHLFGFNRVKCECFKSTPIIMEHPYYLELSHIAFETFIRSAPFINFTSIGHLDAYLSGTIIPSVIVVVLLEIPTDVQ